MIHAELARSLPDYRLRSYSAWRTLFPLLLPTLVDRRAELIHADADYGLFFKRPGVPLVLTMHGYRLDRFMRAYSSPLQYLHYRTDLRLITRMSLAAADRVVAVSEFVAGMIRDDLGFGGEVKVIHNGVDSGRFVPAAQPRRDGPFRVLFCGNHKPAKRPGLLLPLAEALGPEFEVQYTAGLLGKGRLSAKPAPNAAKLTCLGQLRHADMPAVYQAVDALFMPSAREGFCLCAAEAMAAGLPIVAADSSALPELVVDGAGGYLQPADDLTAYVDALRRLSDSPQTLREMGQFNRARVEQHFTLARMAADYATLFAQLRDA